MCAGVGSGLSQRTASRSSAAHAANVRPPTVPVAVSSTPAAVAAATPCGPRISTDAAAPTLSPNGSWPSETTAISTAMASKTDASTPTARSKSQFRAICANTAINTKPTSRTLPRCERSTDSPLLASGASRRRCS